MTITLSQNEIRAEAEKAFRGVGIEWGMAKDGGVIASWMAAHKLPFLGALNHCLEILDENLTEGQSDGAARMVSCIAPFEAIARAEYIAAMNTAWAGEVLMPRFLLAGLGIVAQEQGQAFTLKINGKIAMVAEQNQLWVTADGIASGVVMVEIYPHAEGIEEAGKRGLIPCQWAEQITYKASASCWKKLGQYASRTYVPVRVRQRAPKAFNFIGFYRDTAQKTVQF